MGFEVGRGRHDERRAVNVPEECGARVQRHGVAEGRHAGPCAGGVVEGVLFGGGEVCQIACSHQHQYVGMRVV